MVHCKRLGAENATWLNVIAYNPETLTAYATVDGIVGACRRIGCSHEDGLQISCRKIVKSVSVWSGKNLHSVLT